MKKIAIIGIPDKDLDDLVQKLEHHPQAEVMMFYTAKQFYDEYNRGSADAILIDSSVPDEHFLDLAKNVRKTDKKALIIGVAKRTDNIDKDRFKNKISNSEFLYKVDDNSSNVTQLFDWLENKSSGGLLTRKKEPQKKTAKTILVVDDFENTLNIVEYTLKSNGYDVIGVLSGKEALQKLQSGAEPDLIITDLNMPEMDGFQLIEAIRKIPEHKETPVFILTTDFSFEKKMRAKELGITSWIQKPYKIEEFLDIIKRTIS